MKFGRLLFASAAVFTMSVLATAANAVTVSIGLQQASANGGALTTVATGTDSAFFPGSYGTFTTRSFVAGSSDADFVLGDLLASTALSVSSSTAGTLTIYITAQGLTSPSGNLVFTSNFTSNSLTAGWSVTEETFFSATNGLYTGTSLASHTFTASGTFASINGGLASGLYSVTQKYTITATGSGSAQSTMNISAVPGPMVGAGLPGLIAAAASLLALARRRQKAAI